MSRARIFFSLFVLFFMVGAIGFCVRSLAAAERSSKWDEFRTGIVKEHPYCSLCASDNDLEVHHIVLFSADPSRELDKANVIVLCRHCHWEAGHLGIAWDVGNDEVKELVNGVGEMLWKKRLAVLAERKAAKETPHEAQHP